MESIFALDVTEFFKKNNARHFVPGSPLHIGALKSRVNI